jgi:hypothetical protein
MQDGHEGSDSEQAVVLSLPGRLFAPFFPREAPRRTDSPTRTETSRPPSATRGLCHRRPTGAPPCRRACAARSPSNWTARAHRIGRRAPFTPPAPPRQLLGLGPADLLERAGHNSSLCRSCLANRSSAASGSTVIQCAITVPSNNDRLSMAAWGPKPPSTRCTTARYVFRGSCCLGCDQRVDGVRVNRAPLPLKDVVHAQVAQLLDGLKRGGEVVAHLGFDPCAISGAGQSSSICTSGRRRSIASPFVRSASVGG